MKVIEASMNGWVSVLLIIILQLTAVAVLVRQAVRRWWNYLLILAIAGALFRPMHKLVSGDVSRYLPQFLWSDGSDGKDQIIYASIASTLLLPLIASALILSIARWLLSISRT